MNLKGATPSLTKRVKVQIQNLSSHDENIDSLTTLDELVTLAISPVSECATASLILSPPNKPRVLKAHKKLNVFFEVTFTCAFDDDKGEGHEDFTYSATVHHNALGTGPDTNPVKIGRAHV